ncbi:MAG: NADH-quinone oxidoreductase subunit N [Chloroflexi bacterium]|nr:NADH-quinone oxidoreductase subunit N [Chloroflexota bacterium]MDA1146192.1 NADH-quinone oxidoreductase subunit N [Chloroflexota bacterium]
MTTDLLGNALNLQYELLGPEIAVAVTAALVLFADAFRRELNLGRFALPALSVVGLVVAVVLSSLWIDENKDFARLVTVDNFTTFFRFVFLIVTLVVIVGSHEYIQKHVSHPGEFYSLLLFSTVGAMLMASARDLLTAYLAIEVMSFSLYILVGMAKNDARSGEASLKYVLLGGVASAMLLYGLSFLYGVGGSTQYSEIAAALSRDTSDVQLPLVLGLALIIAGLGFKASAVPFHMWTPDAYEGAPIPITAYLSATSKAATFALLLRWFAGPLLPAIDEWQWMVAAIAVLTMVFGNLVALQQHNIKRLLAYSSIGQVGFMLMAITAVSDNTGSALLLHLTGYLITNLAVFMAVVAFYNRTGTEEISSFRGLAQTNPYLALVMTAGLFSLAGMPLLAGFLTKFILFQSVVSAGYTWLVVIALVASTVSLYYYLQVIRHMYLYEPDGDPSRWRLTPTGYLTTGVLLGGVLFVGLYAAPFYTVADRAIAPLFA